MAIDAKMAKMSEVWNMNDSGGGSDYVNKEAK